MNRTFRIYLTVVVIILLFSEKDGISCSLVYRPPTSFDSTEYIFTGKIVAHTGPLDSRDLIGHYRAIFVEPVDIVHVPGNPKNYYEIIPFSLGPGCELNTMSERSFREKYPIGTELRIVGRKAEHFDASVSPHIVRLEVSPYNNYDMSENIPDSSFLHSTHISIYDYSRTSNDSTESLSSRKLGSRYYYSYTGQHHFELRKDLFRLNQAVTDNEKAIIIRRITQMRTYPHYLIKKVVEEHGNSEMLKSLIPEGRRGSRSRIKRK